MPKTSYRISASTLRRFNALVPQRERNYVVEELMQTELAQREAALAVIVNIYMTDPAFAQCREDEELWESAVNCRTKDLHTACDIDTLLSW